MSDNNLRQSLETALECFNDPEQREQYLAAYAEDVVLHGYSPDLPPGRAGAAAFYQMIWSAFPDATVTAEQIVAECLEIAL